MKGTEAMEKLKAMLPGGEWIVLAEWSHRGAEYDADGWLEHWGRLVGWGVAPLPTSGFVDLRAFIAVAKVEQ